MIAEGNLHAHGGRLAAYISKGNDGEKAEIIDLRGFASGDLREAFCDIQAIAESQTKCENPFFHCYVRLPEGENLRRDQWLEVADRLERKLGFEGQPRGVALHFLEDGTTHMHVGWSRIDTDEMKAIDPGLYIRKMKEVSRALERELGLREVSSELPPDRLTAGVKRPEFEEARRLGVDLVPVRETIRDCFDRSDNGPSFAAALTEHDLTIAQGDRRDFVILDAEGGQHALGKRITGQSAADIRARFGDEFKANLPSVDEARAQIEARQETSRGGQGTEAPAGISHQTMKAEVTALWQAADTGIAFAASLKEAGYVLARGDRRDFVVVDEQGGAHNLTRLIEGAKTADIRAMMVDVDRAALPSVDEAKAEIRAERWQEFREEREAARIERSTVEHGQPIIVGQSSADDVAEAGVQIAQGVAKGIEKALEAVAKPVEILANLIADMFGASAGEKAPVPPAPSAPLSPIEQFRAERRAQAALGRIADSLRDDKPVSTADVQSLTPAHIQSIREGGPEYLQRLLQWQESERARERDDWGRERER